jgi:malate synthase
MAAQIPAKDDAELNSAALEKVRADKLREVGDGHDGTWVAHPALVATAREIFDAHMRGPNQIQRQLDDLRVSEADLLRVPEGTRTMAALRSNIDVGLHYVEAWLRGIGCVPLHHLMEDAATAEISRAQIWQWLHHRAPMDNGRPLSLDRFRGELDAEMARTRMAAGAAAFERSRFRQARELFERLCTADELEEFLTLPAYEMLLEVERPVVTTARSVR